MKKLLAICLALIMVMGISVTVFAAPNGFVSSPSANHSPELVSYTNEDEDCTAELTVTPYSKRDTLPDDARQKLEEAYNIIVNTDDLSKLTDELKKIAEEKDIDTKGLAVSDLFDISYTDCVTHDEHGNFDITLKPETLTNFVALLRLNGDKWEVVKGAKVSGEHLLFTSDANYPFAIVVDAGTASGTPQTGDDSNVVLYVVIMAVSAVAVIILWRKSKKQAE